MSQKQVEQSQHQQPRRMKSTLLHEHTVVKMSASTSIRVAVYRDDIELSDEVPIMQSSPEKKNMIVHKPKRGRPPGSVNRENTKKPSDGDLLSNIQKLAATLTAQYGPVPTKITPIQSVPPQIKPSQQSSHFPLTQQSPHFPIIHHMPDIPSTVTSSAEYPQLGFSSEYVISDTAHQNEDFETSNYETISSDFEQ